jgi:hypothetical protein
MKKLMFVLIVLTPLAITAPGYTFFDWLFSGGASRDAIDNSALGDFRAWWTGNPGYQFNPWWSGPSNPGAQGTTPGANAYGPQAPYPQVPQPSISYSQPQGPPAGYGQPMQPGGQQYQMAPQSYQPTQQYQTTPQAYQSAPQYQPAPQGYQAAPQAMQQPMAQQGYQAAPQMMQQPMAQQGYQGVTGAPQMVPQSYGQ